MHPAHDTAGGLDSETRIYVTVDAYRYFPRRSSSDDAPPVERRGELFQSATQLGGAGLRKGREAAGAVARRQIYYSGAYNERIPFYETTPTATGQGKN